MGSLRLSGTPEAEVELTEGLVRQLLVEQHPDLAADPLELVASGWDNVIFRLGNARALRLPRRTVAAQLIENEQRWLPEISKRLSIPIPVHERVGMPGCGYPWRWSILPWLAGDTANRVEPLPSEALRFAGLLSELHTDAPPDAPVNEFRGVPLIDRAPATAERMERLRDKTDVITPQLMRIWEKALTAPLTRRNQWLHGDLHGRNVLVNQGRLSAIIDWGDITSGDVATDLAAFWMMFDDAQAREVALADYADMTDVLLTRAKGWAVFFGVVLLDTGLVDHPEHAVMGERTLRRLVNG